MSNTKYPGRPPLIATILYLAVVSVAFADTNVYYEIWRNTTNDFSSSERIESWYEGTSYFDSSVQANQTYYYWTRGINAETVDSGWVDWSWSGGYATTVKLTLTCPTSAERDTLSPVSATVTMYPQSNPYTDLPLTTELRESDVLDPDVIQAWDSHGHQPSVREYHTNVKIGDYEPVTNTAEVYLRAKYGTNTWDTKYAYSPNVDVELRDYSDPAPANLTAAGNSQGIQVNWNASTGNTYFSTPVFAQPSNVNITVIGDVDPGDPTAWTSTTDAYVGNTADGMLIVGGGSNIESRITHIGDGSGVSGTATVTGAGSMWANGSLYIGYYGSGTLDITNGGAVSNTFVGIGRESGSTGGVTVDGVGSMWANGSLIVGIYGSGTLNITNSGLVSSGTGKVASGDRGTGTVMVDGTR